MFKHAIYGGLRNLVRSFWLSATAVSVLTASLFLVALFAFVTTSIGFYLRTFDRSLAITAFIKEDVDKATIDIMVNDFKNSPEVSKVTYNDLEKVKENQSEETRITSENLRKNGIESLSEEIVIVPQSTEQYDNLLTKVNSPKYQDVIKDVNASNDAASILKKYHMWVNVGGIVMIIICALVSILVMINILRIAIYQRKNEIEVMRLVGATNGYIRGPFITEGMYYNIIAAILVTIIFILTFTFALPNITEYLGIQSNTSTQKLVNQMYLSLGITIVSGILVGIITTFTATRRYLKL
jgi:cell division transport system permease protein